MSSGAELATAAAPRRFWALAGAAALVGGLLVWMYQDVILRRELLSYRDSLQFYYPLFEYIQQEWQEGRVPLWNPYTNCGEPLLANPTTSIFYPLKLVFCLPLSYWARYHLYVLLHEVLAAASCGWVARRWGASLPAATLAAISYACCGNVMFNYSNIIFLCGAAWLPLALWAGDRMLQERSLRRVPSFAAILALMALSGDIELAYVAGMLTALQALFLWRAAPPVSNPSPLVQRPVPRLLLLAAAAALSLGLTAVQVLPTASFHRHSERAARIVPASLYDLPRYLLSSAELLPRSDTGEVPRWYDGLLGDPPPPANHALMIYRFSHSPLRLIEFFWPNISGRKFPHEHGWMEAIGWVESPWVMSNYMGLLPWLLALAMLSPWGGDSRTRWLFWIVLLALLASLGTYAPGRLFAAEGSPINPEWQDRHRLKSAVGGLYWFLTVALPGFGDFRFPSKLMVAVACGLSLLAAPGFDRWRRSGNGLNWFCGGLAIASIAAAVVVSRWRDPFIAYLEAHRAPEHTTFLSAGACDDLQTALWHGGTIALMIPACSALLRASDRRNWRAAPLLAWLPVALTAVDIAVASQWMIRVTDREAWEQTPALVKYLREAARLRNPEDLRPPRFFRSYKVFTFQRESTRQVAQDEFIRWQRELFTGLQHLPFRLSRVNTAGTMELLEQGVWFHTLPAGEPRVDVQPRRAFDAWGTRTFVVPRTFAVKDPVGSMRALRRSWSANEAATGTWIDPSGPPLEDAVPGRFPIPRLELVQALDNNSAFPPAWIVHRIVPLEPLSPTNEQEWLQVMISMVFPLPDSVPFDLHREAYIEDVATIQDLGKFPVDWPVPAGAEECRLTAYAPGSIELSARLGSEGVIVTSETFTDDWRATVSTDGGPWQDVPVLRTNRTMCGVRLRPGNHRIQLRYEPSSFVIGAWLSLLCTGGVFGWGSLQWLRRRHAG